MENTHRDVYVLVGGLSMVALLVLGGYLYLHYGTNGDASAEQTRVVSEAQPIVVAARGGAWDQAIKTFETEFSKEQVSPTTYARAVKNVSGLAYRSTGDIGHLLEDLKRLKSTAIDSLVSNGARAGNIQTIAQAYHQSGGDASVYQYMFEGKPFSAYKAAATTTSVRNLYSWSFEVSPSTRAAIGVASMDMLTVLNTPAMSQQEKDQLTGEAETYMRYADNIVKAEAAHVSDFFESNKYAGYLFWKAFVVGALALEKGSPYSEQFHVEYNELFSKIAAQNSAQSASYIPIAHWHYATFLLLVDQDEAKARAEIARVPSMVTKTNQDFLNNIRNQASGSLDPDDFLGNSIKQMRHISPEFEAFVVSEVLN